MEEIRKERLMLAITSLAAIACILQNFFGGWEFWMPAVVLVGALILWWLHITQKLDQSARTIVYYIYTAFLFFYLGIHPDSMYDISAAMVLFIATYSVADRIMMLNLILIEYVVVMAVQFWFLYTDDVTDFKAFTVMRICFHVATVLIMYMFCRITVRSRATESERIRKWQESVGNNNRDMQDFLSNVSHELRTPLNVIGGMTAIMQKKTDATELEAIQEAEIRLAHQVDDIQDYTEIKRGELALEEENYMCISLINDVVANYNAIYKNSDLELIIDLSPETPSMLNGDIKKLHKIFRHLLSNAMKFTRRGGVYIRVFSVPQEYGVNLTIEITDTGIGMTRAAMSSLSKGMYQANKKRNRSTGGIGIGLPIVYGFVRKMGGFVRITSEKGRGTTVRISIPQTVVDPAPCLSIKQEVRDGIIFYIRPNKYKVPEIREYYRYMAVNLATGLKTRLYSASDEGELRQLIGEYAVSYIFTGQEEYEADQTLLDYLSSEGYKVVVTAAPGFSVTPGSGVYLMPKPLYAFPITRIINGEAGIEAYLTEEEKKLLFTGVNALVVDDEPMNLVVASGLLREYKMLVDTAESGKAAIEKYENGTYDVIFMDHMMPEMDGVEAMKQIRQIAARDGRNPVIVALTANALSTAREMFLQEGFDGFIAKPIDIGVFERVMKSVLPEEMIHYEGRAGL